MTLRPTPGVLWNTLRHLQPRQVRYQVGKRLLTRRRSISLALNWQQISPKIIRQKNTDRVYFDGRAGFTFNNESRVFEKDCNGASAGKLWLYNLHYMHWLFDLKGGAETWIEKWIKKNPYDSNNAGWDPYPTSLRLFNWTKLYSMSGKTPGPEVLTSMEFQTGYLLNNLEFHLGGNHLLENLLALTSVGHFLEPAHPASAAAEKKIQVFLEKELNEQFLGDGGHYELSPMYHAILLERILDLINMWPGRETYFKGIKGKLQTLALSALDWLNTMSVNGRFALFNDSAYDAAPSADHLLDYGRELLDWKPLKWNPGPEIKLRALKDSGYYRADSGPLTLIFDGGQLGPDHQMGHAQGDMLSFCLWTNQQPVIVHPGNYEYLPGEMRDYCRSTAAHNTLSLEGAEQADWWASHRVGWRGQTFNVTANEEMQSKGIYLTGSHDGYSRLSGKPVHTRSIRLMRNRLTVEDRLSTDVGRRCRIFFHLHPDCEIENKSGVLIIKIAQSSIKMQSDQPIRLEDSWYCPEFGMRIRNKAAVVEPSVFPVATHFDWIT